MYRSLSVSLVHSCKAIRHFDVSGKPTFVLLKASPSELFPAGEEGLPNPAYARVHQQGRYSECVTIASMDKYTVKLL